MTKISPSLLSADFGNLYKAIDMLNSSAASMIHIDIMDGVFVPNISLGFPVMKAVSKRAKLPLDVHMMIVNPHNYINQVRDAGGAIMNVHIEACTHLHRTVQAIKAAGMKAGVTLNPATPIVMLEDIIGDIDLVLLMSVNPGYGGQQFIPSVLPKLTRLRELCASTGYHPMIEIDGGVNLLTGQELVKAGAEVLVAGNYVFSAPDPREAIASLAAL
ncbi:MAG: ribulose-phosphate 3-epimerase [Bacteroidales bacterium]|nr:ribulose-phosphate 3-epimerase [Bacteroidales bacterium]